MATSTLFAGLGCLLVAFIIYFRKFKANARNAHLPPGPKPVPILGNIRDLQAKELWLPAIRWAKEYGDVVYLHVLGQGLVFLNSPKAASELLDQRGVIYSDKPQFTMVCDLCDCKNMVAFTPYGEQSKRQRRLMHKAFALPRIPNYYPLMTTATSNLLSQLISSPSDYLAHVRRYGGSLTLDVVYGYEVTSNHDSFLNMAEECVAALSNDIASTASIWLVDLFPSLAHIPAWVERLPGVTFKQKARMWKKMMADFVDGPFEYVKNSMKSGAVKHSFCSSLMEDENFVKSSENFEFDLKWTANSMYSASLDTTVTTVSHFLLAMMDNPEILKKAQQEIDAVVGQERLPTFHDRASLPYIGAILNETWRWGVPVPLNLPHRLMEDDVYNGMHIPKGSLVFGNIWAMCRNENLYPNPDAFNPDRFLEEVDAETKRSRDPRNYVFGFGRRRCPGNDLVDSSLWLVIANMIATLSISKPVDDAGNVIEPEIVFENAVFRTPKPFQCDLRPRSEKALQLIQQFNH